MKSCKKNHLFPGFFSLIFAKLACPTEIQRSPLISPELISNLKQSLLNTGHIVAGKRKETQSGKREKYVGHDSHSELLILQNPIVLRIRDAFGSVRVGELKNFFL